MVIIVIVIIVLPWFIAQTTTINVTRQNFFEDLMKIFVINGDTSRLFYSIQALHDFAYLIHWASCLVVLVGRFVTSWLSLSLSLWLWLWLWLWMWLWLSFTLLASLPILWNLLRVVRKCVWRARAHSFPVWNIYQCNGAQLQNR